MNQQTDEQTLRIEEARQRIAVLALDTATSEMRDTRRVTLKEHIALLVLESELHRLHVAVSEQRKTLESSARARTKPHRKPTDARSPAPTTPKPKEKS